MKNINISPLIEWIKYEHNEKKQPLVSMLSLVIKTLSIVKKDALAFKIVSNIFRAGWQGSEKIAEEYSRKVFFETPEIGDEIITKFVKNITAEPHTEKFFHDPGLMLNGVITVLKSPKKHDEGLEKGALIINYSYYFPLFIRFFDVNTIAKQYHIILEPSWAGFCEESILAYTQFDFPVFLQTYEKRDKKFIQSLQSNIVTMDIGPSWFINHENFTTSKVDRDIDIIIVAAWARFKRHYHFFKAIKKLAILKPDLKIVCVGYPVDLTKQDIIQYAEEFKLNSHLEIFELIPPEEVAKLQQRAKVNVLWSKFEGNNRAIIEGMFCDTPVILREGHNYGENYDFINNTTGAFANEKNLVEVASKFILETHTKSPREYVMNNRNCIVGTQIMNNIIQGYDVNNQNKWSSDLVIKINDLHGMSYLNIQADKFSKDYQWLSEKMEQNAKWK